MDYEVQNKFKNVITACITPFDQNLNVNFKEFKRLISHLENNTDSILVFGTTGESPTLTLQEKIEISKFVKENTNLPVIANISSNNYEKALKELEEFNKLNLDGYLITTPYYNKPPQDALYDYFYNLSTNTDRPIMIYNIPSRTGVDLLPDTIVELAKINNIIALKQSHSDISKVIEIKAKLIKNKLDKKFFIYSGDDILTLPLLSLGAYGVVSVASHLIGRELKTMIKEFKNNPSVSYEIHYKYYDLFNVLFITTNPIPVKQAMEFLGFDVNNLRKPLRKANEKEKEAILKVLQDLNLLAKV
ncbi:MAG: 4-hydroxy-tetrahydrodipicolinate synthase [bacterium]